MITRTIRVLLLLAIVAGCRGEVVSSTEDHDPFHQHDHHIPRHRPANLASAVIRLRWRQERLDDEKISAFKREQLQAEFLDIIRWLPEIAGDSDLPEVQWNIVDAHSTELQQIAARTKDLKSTDFQEALNRALNDMAEITKAALPSVALSGK